MFGLEQSIADWRRQMLAGGIKTPVPPEELESHLRDDIDRQMCSGVTVEQAFEIAVQEIGRPILLKSEFRKNERTIMKKTMLILLGIFGVLFGAAFVMPAMAWYRVHGAMPAEQLEFLLLGIVITLGGIGAAIYGFKQRKA